MVKSRIVIAATAVIVVAVASGVFAQDREQRRNLLRKGVELAAEVAVDAAQKSAAEMIHGQVLNLGAKVGNKPLEVNKGGLVIVKVDDTGSRPNEDLKVEAGRAFQRLGQVRPARAKPGAGSEWVLFKPVTEGEATITVTYTPNGGGDAVTRTHTITVTAADDGESPAVGPAK